MSLMEIANKMIPNILRSTAAPPLPSLACSQSEDLITKNTINRLTIIPIIMFSTAYSARNASSVVSVPAPAMKGKAIGTIEADIASSDSLKKLAPSTISNPIIKITIPPAIENCFAEKQKKYHDNTRSNRRFARFYAVAFFFETDNDRNISNNIND